LVGKREGKSHLEDLDVDGRIILKSILGKQVLRVWNAFIWLRIGTIGRILGTRKQAFGFYENRSFLDWLGVMSASEEGLCCMELVTDNEGQ
jgi:hypothetical protein